MQKRIYSNYNNDEYDLVRAKSQEMDLSLSQYQKYITLLRLTLQNNFSIPYLQNKMILGISDSKSEDVFIVSTFLSSEWVSLTQSQKKILATFLSNYAKNNPLILKKHKKISGNIWQYIKI